MPYASNWGLNIRINVRALQTFESAAKALEEGTKRMNRIGSSTQKTIENLGSAMKTQTQQLNQMVNQLESSIKRAEGVMRGAKFGGGAGGGASDAIVDTYSRTRNKGRNTLASDQWMRKNFGLTEEFVNLFRPNSKIKANDPRRAWFGNFPAPDKRQVNGRTEYFYTKNQLNSILMQGKIAYPIVQRLGQLERNLVQALRAAVSSIANAGGATAATARTAKAQQPQWPDLIDDLPTPSRRRGASRSRAPPYQTASVSHSPFRIDNSRAFAEAAASSSLDLQSQQAEFRELFAKHFLKTKLTAKSGGSYWRSMNAKRRTDLEQFNNRELLAAAVQMRMVPETKTNLRAQKFFADPRFKTLTGYLSENLGSVVGGMNDPASLRSNLRQRRGKKSLMGFDYGTALLGDIFDKLLGAQPYGTRGQIAPTKTTGQVPEAALKKLIDKYDRLMVVNEDYKGRLSQMAKRIYELEKGTGQRTARGKAAKKGRARRGFEEVEVGAGGAYDDPGATDSPAPKRRGLLDWRSDATTPDKFRGAFDRVLNWGAAAMVVYGGFSQLKDSVKNMADFEAEMIKVKKVLNPLGADMNKLTEAAKSLGMEFGANIKDVADGMQIFAQQGMGMNEILEQTTDLGARDERHGVELGRRDRGPDRRPEAVPARHQ
jgi:hypothetical protein